MAKRKKKTGPKRKPPSRKKPGKGARSRPKPPIRRNKPKAKPKPRPKKPAYRKPKKPVRGEAKLRKRRKLAHERAEYLREVFDRARGAIDSKFLPSLVVHENRDATVDGELRIRQIPRGQSARSALLEIEENVFGLVNMGSEWWVGVSILVAQRAKDAERSPMPRYKGLARAAVYPQRATTFKLATQWATARGVVRRLEQSAYRKPEQILVRFHWNPTGEKPNR